MKYQALVVVALSGLIGFSAAALAGSGKYGDGKGPFMSFFDTNGDNMVTMNEFNEAAAKRFEAMDTDNDGVVSTVEFQSFIKEKRKDRHEQRFLSMDTDKDGSVSRDEYISYKQQRAERRFQGMDSNNDGVVSKEEYAARKSRWSHHKHGRHGKGGIFAKLDANSDGQLTREESLAAWTNWFKRIDADGDQVVTADEVRDYRNKKMLSWK
ncbi:EF-hand domain-containing protein [Kaarinaea lacus]